MRNEVLKHLIGSGIKGTVDLSRAQLPDCLPPENICFQGRARHFQLQEVIIFFFSFLFVVFFALSVNDGGNMPPIQLIPREGLKSPYSNEGWIVVWSR